MRIYIWEEYKKIQLERALREQQRKAEKKKMEERFMNNIRKKNQANTKK